MPLACLPLMRAHAQGDTTRIIAEEDTTRVVGESCDDKLISEIVVIRQPPALFSKVRPAWIRPVAGMVVQHRTTKATAIVPFLQVEQGEKCSDFRLAESARVLRAQPYIADAEVRAYPDSSGGVRVEVTTVDEIPLVLGAEFRRGNFSKFSYGNSNIMGDGLYSVVEWRQGFAYRDGFGARFINHHAFGGANAFELRLQRFPLTTLYSAALAHPFYTQFQRMGWFAGIRRHNDYVDFLRPDDRTLSLQITRTQWDVGGVFRVGGGQGHFFAGPLLSQQRTTPDSSATIITDSGFAGTADTVLDGRYSSRYSTRLLAVVGMRFLSFIKARGFDALTGPQDVGEGVQLSTVFGRGIGSGEHDALVGADLYAGVGSEKSFLGIRSQWETQRQNDVGRWGDVVGSTRLAWYYKPSDSGTWITDLELSGGWRQRTPFQLTIGDNRGGLRGYSGSRIAGARRVVMRLERRWVLGGFTRFDNIGIAAFGDAGKMWAGAVPFGVNSGVKASLGVSLLAAVPKQSRRLVRLDLAMPIVRTPHTGFRVRAGITAPMPGLWREPSDVTRARSLALSSNVFTWP
ncbi:MAG TPA: hypothetical protein VIQ74_06990 [Gemmatimonadaceae bacterium]